MLVRELSKELFERALHMIPGGVNSPVRSFREVDLLPVIAKQGKGEILVDVDDRSYVDYCMSWGALILGHAHPKVVKAVQEQMALGSSFGLSTELEQKIAKKILSFVPSVEKLRFVSSGTEATMSALRLARAYTGKSRFIKFNGNYHGHADPFLVRAGSGVALLPEASSLGVPQETVQYTLSLPYNDPQAVKDAFRKYDDIAAVIVEPVAANMGLVPGTTEFLETLRRETERNGALLIFDEVVTGFRVSLGGAQKIYGVVPDITCLGKIIGGGLPAAAFGGKREIMDLLAPLGPVYQAGTLSGNPLALAAGLVTLEEVSVPGFYEELDRKADWLLSPLEDYIRTSKKNVCIQRQGSGFTLFFGVTKVDRQEDLKTLDKDLFARFFRYMLSNGVYFPPSQQEASFLSAAHTEESLDRTLQLCLAFLEDL